MPASIGSKITAVLTASTSGFTSGLQKARRQLDDFVGAVPKLGAVLGGLSFAGAAAGLEHLVQSQMEAIDATAKQADALGVSTEGLSRLQYAASYAGASNEELTGGLTKMLKALDAASGGTGPAADAFKRLGLNVAQLKSLSPDQAFAKIGDALGTVQNPAERAALTIDLFGKSGLKLAATLATGSEGIKAFGAEADAVGYSFSRIDAATVEQANDSLTKLYNILLGVGRQIAIQISPAITEAATRLAAWFTSGQSAGAVVASVLEKVVKFIGFAADVLKVFEAGWYGLKVVAGGILLGIAQSLGQVVKAIDWVLQKLHLSEGGASTFADGITAGLAEGMKDDAAKAAQAWDDALNGKASKAVNKFLSDAQTHADAAAKDMADKAARAVPTFVQSLSAALASGKSLLAKGASTLWSALSEEADKRAAKVEEDLAEMRKRVAQFGMSEGQKQAQDLAAKGATPGQLAEAKALADKLDALEHQKKLMEDAKKIVEDTLTPQEQFIEKQKELNELRDAGLLTQSQYDKALDDANQKRQQDVFKGFSSGPTSTAAVEMRVTAGFRNKEDPQAKRLDRLIALHQASLGIYSDIEKNTENLSATVDL